MKKSNYIKFMKDGNKLYLYNLINNAILAFPMKGFDLINLVLSLPDVDYENKLIENFKKVLYSNGFLIDNNVDEIKILKDRYNFAKSESRTFSIQITTTMACNLRCSYCYESHKSVSLNKSKQDALIKFVNRNINNWNALNINWFGGEPLLQMDMIKNISEKLIKICDEHSVVYKGFIITNGYLLNTNNAKLLKLYRVKEAQITIDGDQYEHDKKKFLINGEGTYNVIINNIFKVKDYFDRFRIRVNIDDQPLSSLMDIIYRLEPIKEKILISFLPIQKTEEYDVIRKSYKEYLDKVKELNYVAIKKGYQVSLDYQVSGNIYCAAYNDNCLLIDAKGDIHKCVVTTGKHEHSIAHLSNDGTIVKNEKFSKQNFNPFEDNDCRSCDCLPLCMGGCQNYLIDGKKASERCIIKNNLNMILSNAIQKCQAK